MYGQELANVSRVCVSPTVELPRRIHSITDPIADGDSLFEDTWCPNAIDFDCSPRACLLLFCERVRACAGVRQWRLQIVVWFVPYILFHAYRLVSAKLKIQ